MGSVEGFEDGSTDRIVVVHDSHHLRLLAFDCDVINDCDNDQDTNKDKCSNCNHNKQNSNVTIDSSHFKINKY
jgi:hypothetical protein